MDDKSGQGNAAAIIEAARASKEPRLIDCADQGVHAPALLVPTAGGGWEVRDVSTMIDAFRSRPQRRKGTATLGDVASFAAHANRFKDAGSAIFVDAGAAPKFTSVIDYHPQGQVADVDPRFGEHRGVYTPEFSLEWVKWRGLVGAEMSQAQFAQLMQDRAFDVFDVEDSDPRLAELVTWYARRFGGGRSPSGYYGTSQALLSLAEGLTVTVEDRVSDVTRRDSGGVRVSFDSTAQTDVEVPAAFVVAIPVFKGGDLWQLPVRLRCAIKSTGDVKRVVWRCEMFGADRTVTAVLADMTKTIGTATGLPMFVGAPEV